MNRLLALEVQPLGVAQAFGAGADAAQRNRLLEIQAAEADQQRADRQVQREVLPGAMSGDPEALKKLAGVNPQMWMNLDANRRQRLAEVSAKTGALMYGIEQLPEADRPAAYSQARQRVIGLGGDAAQIPEVYNPAFVRGLINESMSVADLVKANDPSKRYKEVNGQIVDLTGPAGPRSVMTVPKQQEPPAGYTWNDPADPTKGFRLAPGYAEGQGSIKGAESKATLNDRMAVAAAGKPSVDVKLDTKAGEGLIKMDTETLSGVQGGVTSLRSIKPKLDLIEGALKKFETGFAGDKVLTLKQIMSRAGFKADGVSEGELIQSLVSEMAPQMRVPGSGATSDFEMQAFINALPNLTRTPQGNKLVVATLRTMIDRKQKESDYMRRYFRENGNSLEGVYDAMDRDLGSVFARPQSPQEADKLPSGSLYFTPNGEMVVR